MKGKVWSRAPARSNDSNMQDGGVWVERGRSEPPVDRSQIVAGVSRLVVKGSSV